MPGDTQNRSIGYVDYDFESLVTALINRLHSADDAWLDIYRSGTGQMLIEFFAYVAELILYYVERRSSELYLPTAQLRSSVLNIVRLLNYRPYRTTSSSGVLRFYLDSAHTRKIYIPRFLVCRSQSGYDFFVSEDIVIFPGQTSVDVTGYQGTPTTVTFTSDGSSGQEYHIANQYVEQDFLEVYVDGVLWTEVTSFIDSTYNSQHYMVRYELDDTVTIVFGDGTFGKIPPEGVTITINYVESAGVNGNVYSTGKITSIVDTVYDDQNSSVTVNVTNITQFLGGSDRESTEHIRNYAPRVFATGDRAVTRLDFKTILEDYPAVQTANAWGENEEDPPNYDMFNRVKFSVVLDEWAVPDENFIDTLADYLQQKALLTVKYEFVDPDIVYIIPVLDVYAEAADTLSRVEENVRNAIDNQFTLGSTAVLGQSIYYSDVLAAVDGAEGVHHAHLTFEILHNYQGGTETLQLIPVLPGSVSVYVNSTKIGADDGSGSFYPLDSSKILEGTINYTTGEVVLTNVDSSFFDSGETIADNLFLRYQQNQEGDLIVGYNQICKIYDYDFETLEFYQSPTSSS